MTVRTLVLLRHAKAETPDDKPDFDRVLTQAGRAAAQAAGAWLAEQGIHPQVVLCSAAKRTRETWECAAVALPDAAVTYDEDLYDGGRTDVIDQLRAVPDDVETVLVIGHNPTISDVSVLLTPRHTGGLKTSGIAVHRTERPWSQTEPGSMELVLEHTARG